MFLCPAHRAYRVGALFLTWLDRFPNLPSLWPSPDNLARLGLIVVGLPHIRPGCADVFEPYIRVATEGALQAETSEVTS